MKALLAALYGLFSYLFFFVTFLYAIGFVGNVWVPKGIDSGEAVPLVEALLVNTLLLGLFAVQHSVMARSGFKRWFTRIVPHAVERSTFVLLASAILALMFWQWRALPAMVWTVADPIAAGVLQGVFWMGWGILLLATFLINHFELFGLVQALGPLTGRSAVEPEFRTPLLYRYVRHPIYLGFILAFWATPAMSAGHLLFALATTGYILIGIWFEERDLVAQFGERYRAYRKQVGMLVPRLGKPAAADSAAAERV